MTDEEGYNPKTVKDYVPVAKVAPITNKVTSIDVHAFRQVMADALARLSSRYTHKVSLIGGYAFLVEKELVLEYKLRLNNPNAKIPAPQPVPTKPTPELSMKMKTYYSEMKSYRMEHDCNIDVRNLLDQKFPGILNPLKHTRLGSFNSVLTVWDAFDFVDKAVGSTATSNKKYLDHVRAVLDREYSSEQSETEIYFTMCENGQYKAKSTGTSYVPKSLLIAAAQHAFHQAVNKDKMQQINDSWELVKDLDVQYEKFKEHCTKHLNNWTRNMVDMAHVVMELADRRETLQSVVDSQNHLQDQYTAQTKVGYNMYHNPPSMVAATTNTTNSSNTVNSVPPSTAYPDFEGILQRALQTQAALAEKVLANNRPQPSQNNKTTHHRNDNNKASTSNTTPMWRQWKYWCYICGVSLTQNTNGCKQWRKDSNHNNFPNVTRDNPQGGNDTRDKLWLQWYNPVTYRAQVTKGSDE